MSEPTGASLRRRIPALIALILAAGVGTFGIIAYRVVRESTVQSADARLRDASSQLAAMFGTSFDRLLDTTRAVATDTVLAARLAGAAAPPESVLAALRRLGVPGGTVRGSELRDVTGATVASLPGGSSVHAPRDVRADSGVQPLFQAGDTVYYEVVAPVTWQGHTIGSVVSLRSLTTTADAARQIGQLIGIKSGILLGNADGTVWTDLVDVVPPPPTGSALSVYDRAGRSVRGAVQRIGTTPMSVAVEFSQDEILARSRGIAGAFMALAAIVIALGAFGGLLLTRPITGSLKSLADTADTIAAGNLHVPAVAQDRKDEIGRLARSFNTMAANLRTVHGTLEHLVEERTATLKETVAQLKDTQEELVRKERLATLGQLSSGVGHELRNPLGVMTNAVYFLHHVLSDAPSKVREYLDLLQSQIHLCEKIVSDLLDFARTRPPQTSPVAVPELLHEQMNRVTATPNIEVVWDLPDGLPEIAVDAVQIGQVLLNLLTNGVQAIEETGGTLTVGARREGSMVAISVADSGQGVAPENRTRVFEPLFTTKARGIGLGLSVSRSLARANGGELTLGEGGAGAVFVLTVPVWEGAGP